MPGKHLLTTIGEFTPFAYGKGLPLRDRDISCDIPVYGSNGIVGYHSTALTKGPTVIIGRKGTVGAVHFSPVPCWPIDTTFFVTGPDLELVRFKYFLLKAIGLDSMNSDSAVPGLNREQAHGEAVRIPKSEIEQRWVARILGTLDDKIELNRRMAATLEEMARAIFKSWFIDFDPVRAKAEGRPTNLPPEIDVLFPDSFEEDAVGNRPTGWRRGQLADVTGFQGGYAFKSKDWVEQGIPVVKIGSVKPGLVDLNSVSCVTEEVAAEAARFRLTPGDLLIGMTGYVGEVGLVPITDNPPLLNQRVGKFVQDKPGTSSIAYIYCLTRDADFKAQVESKSHGTAQANVSADGIQSVPIVVPPKALRDLFNVLVRPIIDRILDAHAVSNTLTITRDTLLPKLISGEIVIRSEGV